MSKTITVERSLFAILSLILLYAVFFHYWDLPIDLWANQTFPDTVWYKISQVCGVIFKPACWFILAVICLLIGYRRRSQGLGQHYYLFGGSIILALIIATLAKFGLARYRPIEWFQHQFYGFHFFSTQHDFNSTPSGHTTATFAALFALSHIRKKLGLTLLLMLIAVLVGFSRLVLVDHYPSDVIFGAYLGILSVYWMEALLRKKF